MRQGTSQHLVTEPHVYSPERTHSEKDARVLLLEGRRASRTPRVLTWKLQPLGDLAWVSCHMLRGLGVCRGGVQHIWSSPPGPHRGLQGRAFLLLARRAGYAAKHHGGWEQKKRRLEVQWSCSQKAPHGKVSTLLTLYNIFTKCHNLIIPVHTSRTVTEGHKIVLPKLLEL